MFDILNVLATEARDMFKPASKMVTGSGGFKMNAIDLGGGGGVCRYDAPDDYNKGGVTRRYVLGGGQV